MERKHPVNSSAAYLFLLSWMVLCFSYGFAESAHKNWRDIKDDIARCPYLSTIDTSHWKDVKEPVEHFGDQKDYAIMKATSNGEEFIFGSQIKHSKMPRWTLLIMDHVKKKPLYRFSGFIIADEESYEYDIDQVALSINECKNPNLLADLRNVFAGVPPTVFGVKGENVEEISVNEDCSNKPGRVIRCGGGIGRNLPVSYPASDMEKGKYLLNIEYKFGIPKRDLYVAQKCSRYGDLIAGALKHLYKRDYVRREHTVILPEKQ